MAGVDGDVDLLPLRVVQLVADDDSLIFAN